LLTEITDRTELPAIVTTRRITTALSDRWEGKGCRSEPVWQQIWCFSASG